MVLEAYSVAAQCALRQQFVRFHENIMRRPVLGVMDAEHGGFADAITGFEEREWHSSAEREGVLYVMTTAKAPLRARACCWREQGREYD